MKIRDSSAREMEFCGVFVWRKVWKYYHFPLSKFRFRFVNAASLTWSGIYYRFFLYLIAFFLHRSHSITSKIWVQFPVFKAEFLEEHTKSWLWPTDILNHWYCFIKPAVNMLITKYLCFSDESVKSILGRRKEDKIELL